MNDKEILIGMIEGYLEEKLERRMPLTAAHLAYYLMAHGVTIEQPTWISVDERLPAKWTAVLTYRKGYGVGIGLRLSTGNWNDDRNLASPVTHWMPLPQPPKGV